MGDIPKKEREQRTTGTIPAHDYLPLQLDHMRRQQSRIGSSSTEGQTGRPRPNAGDLEELPHSGIGG